MSQLAPLAERALMGLYAWPPCTLRIKDPGSMTPSLPTPPACLPPKKLLSPDPPYLAMRAAAGSIGGLRLLIRPTRERRARVVQGWASRRRTHSRFARVQARKGIAMYAMVWQDHRGLRRRDGERSSLEKW